MSLFAKMLSDIRHSSGVAGDSLSLQVTNLVDNVWEEASGELRQVLSVPIESLKAEKVLTHLHPPSHPHPLLLSLSLSF